MTKPPPRRKKPAPRKKNGQYEKLDPKAPDRYDSAPVKAELHRMLHDGADTVTIVDTRAKATPAHIRAYFAKNPQRIIQLTVAQRIALRLLYMAEQGEWRAIQTVLAYLVGPEPQAEGADGGGVRAMIVAFAGTAEHQRIVQSAIPREKMLPDPTILDLTPSGKKR